MGEGKKCKQTNRRQISQYILDTALRRNIKSFEQQTELSRIQDLNMFGVMHKVCLLKFTFF